MTIVIKKFVKKNYKIIFCMFLLPACAVAGKKMATQALGFYTPTDHDMSDDHYTSPQTSGLGFYTPTDHDMSDDHYTSPQTSGLGFHTPTDDDMSMDSRRSIDSIETRGLPNHSPGWRGYQKGEARGWWDSRPRGYFSVGGEEDNKSPFNSGFMNEKGHSIPGVHYPYGEIDEFNSGFINEKSASTPDVHVPYGKSEESKSDERTSGTTRSGKKYAQADTKPLKKAIMKKNKQEDTLKKDKEYLKNRIASLA
jgi:hypothetical protein